MLGLVHWSDWSAQAGASVRRSFKRDLVVCIDTCLDMRLDLCLDMYLDMCSGMCLDIAPECRHSLKA